MWSKSTVSPMPGVWNLVKAISALVKRLEALAADVRARAQSISDAREEPMFVALADGVDARIRRLQSN